MSTVSALSQPPPDPRGPTLTLPCPPLSAYLLDLLQPLCLTFCLSPQGAIPPWRRPASPPLPPSTPASTQTCTGSTTSAPMPARKHDRAIVLTSGSLLPPHLHTQHMACGYTQLERYAKLCLALPKQQGVSERKPIQWAASFMPAARDYQPSLRHHPGTPEPYSLSTPTLYRPL